MEDFSRLPFLSWLWSESTKVSERAVIKKNLVFDMFLLFWGFLVILITMCSKIRLKRAPVFELQNNGTPVSYILTSSWGEKILLGYFCDTTWYSDFIETTVFCGSKVWENHLIVTRRLHCFTNCFQVAIFKKLPTKSTLKFEGDGFSKFWESLVVYLGARSENEVVVKLKHQEHIDISQTMHSLTSELFGRIFSEENLIDPFRILSKLLKV